MQPVEMIEITYRFALPKETRELLDADQLKDVVYKAFSGEVQRQIMAAMRQGCENAATAT